MMHFGPARGDHKDAAAYRRTADAFRRRDLQTVAETIHEDVVWHFPGNSWLSGEIQGRDRLLAYLRQIFVRTNETFVLEDVHIAGSDHHLVAIQRFGATWDGKTEMFDAISVMRFEGGRQIERWFHLVALDAFDAFDAFFMKFV